MKQHEAVIRVMEANSGYATFGFLYQHTLEVPGVEWKTKTPFASIRRIVQDERFFFKIRPGLWALKSWRDRLPPEMIPSKKESYVQREFSHRYYQGLLLQIGNLQDFQTFVTPRDKNTIFLATESLGNLASVKKIYQFCYPNIVNRANTIDVIWFNSRKMPTSLFEVEHTTDIEHSLNKFIDFQDFRTDMVIVADERRKTQFQQIVSHHAFDPIRERVCFQSYNDVAAEHEHLSELKSLKQKKYGFTHS